MRIKNEVPYSPFIKIQRCECIIFLLHDIHVHTFLVFVIIYAILNHTSWHNNQNNDDYYFYYPKKWFMLFNTSPVTIYCCNKLL